MDKADAVRIIDYLAVDDYYGLWELTGALLADFPDESADRRRRIAESALRDLIERGMMDVFRGTFFTGDQRMVPEQEIDRALADQWWQQVAASGEHTRVYASELRPRDLGDPLPWQT